MTALVFGLDETGVWIATDSLALTTGGNPHKYASKIFPLPHLSAALVGTGSMNVVVDWYAQVQMNVIACNILYLNSIAPAILHDISKKHEYLGVTTTTIYHFGYDDDQARFRGFAFRSTNGFACEELIYGVGVKPYGEELLTAFIAECSGAPSLEDIIGLVEQQKKRDDSLPQDKRLGIGGEIHFLLLNDQGQYLWRCHRFPEYSQLYAQMLNSLAKAQQQGPE